MASSAVKGAKGNPARIRMANPTKKAKRIANRNRNERVVGFNSLTRQRNYMRAHKRDKIAN